MRLSRGPAAPPHPGAPLSSGLGTATEPGGTVPKSRGARYPSPKPPCLSFPSARTDRQKGHARAPDACVRANTPGAVRVLCVCYTQCVWQGVACICTPASVQACASVHIPASHSSSRCVGRFLCSHTQVHVQSCAHSHGFVHGCASPSSLGTCSHRATCWSLGSPQGSCHPTRERGAQGWVYTHACTCVCTGMSSPIRHPSNSRGKSSPGPGAPTLQLLGDSKA